MSFFDLVLAVAAEDLCIELKGHLPVPWADFLLNPRRLRGSDFLMRWSQGVWSEKRIIQAVRETGRFFGLPYGPSGTAPDDDPRAYELYFERLEKASSEGLKRPDLLLFRKADETLVQEIVHEIGGVAELPFTHEEDDRIRRLLTASFLAVECENSLWRAKQMPEFGLELTAQKRLGGKRGLKRTAVVPTVIIKEEDRERLVGWQKAKGIPIHIWHVFFDLAFGISLEKAEALIKNGDIVATEQVFQAPGGATTKKIIYKIYYQHAYRLGEGCEEPTLVAEHLTDKNGHILPYVKFEGGRLLLAEDAVAILERISDVERPRK